MGEHILENGFLKVTVADRGAELVSAFDRQRNAERIWTGDPEVWNRHSPILFPFVGKVVDGRYRIGDREYPMKTQHGFARDMDFECMEATATSVAHCLAATEQTRAQYPYDFRLTVTHRLEGRTLHVEWSVENLGGEAMVFSIGGHPGFLLPEGVRKEDCSILFPGAADELRYLGANQAGYVIDRLKALPLRDGRAPYREDIPDTWIFEDGQVRRVGIATPDGKPFVMLNCEQFPMLAVWANPKGPFICLEPWFGRTDDEGFTGTIDQKKGVQTLEAGARRDISYSIDF